MRCETGLRPPKEDLTNALAHSLEVSPLARDIPDIDNYLGLMHTFFSLEDRYGLTIETRDGEVIFYIDSRKGRDAARVFEMVYARAPIAEKYRAGEISRGEYDKWRYNYPQYDTSQQWVKIPSLELSDTIINNKG